MAGLILTKSNEQLLTEEKAAAAIPVDEERAMTSLAAFIRTAWTRAVEAKQTVSDQMIENMRQKAGEYDAGKLAKIKAVALGAEVFMMITSAKCISGEAWVKDIIFQPGLKPWDIEPTPVPELPKEIEDQLRETFLQEASQQMAMRMQMQGMPPSPEAIAMFLFDNKDKIDGQINKIFEEHAKEKADKMERQIEDQLLEGGYYKALDKIIPDIIALKAGFIKGPVKRKEKIKRVVNEQGTLRLKVEERKIDQYDRVSPFDIFPSKDSTDINDGYLIERISLRRDQISSLLSMPEEDGFNHNEIREVLKEYKSGGLREWTTIDSDKEVLENRDTDPYDTSKIDCLQFWGPVPGSILKEWGGKLGELVTDDDIDYHICASMIGRHIIQGVPNEDPMGEKPYSKTAFVKEPGAFWGKGVPELIADCQQVCNATARAILNNVGIASGPQVERNIDRIPEGENKQIYPWKTWDVTNDQMSMNNAPALTFYSPPLVVQNLIVVYDKFSKIADEHSGIPAYSHGDPNVGGAGNTASGFSMFMSAANRGIKAVIKNIDNDIIVTSIERQFYSNLREKEFAAFVGDLKVKATGSSALLAKEQQAVRLNEFARTTANPIDFQITGIEGRKYILRTTAKSLDLEVDKAVPEQFGPMAPMQQLNPAPQIGGAAPMPGPETVDQAGNAAQGMNFKLFEGGPTNA